MSCRATALLGSRFTLGLVFLVRHRLYDSGGTSQVLREAGDVTPDFPPSGIRAERLFCAWARLKQWAASLRPRLRYAARFLSSSAERTPRRSGPTAQIVGALRLHPAGTEVSAQRAGTGRASPCQRDYEQPTETAEALI